LERGNRQRRVVLNNSLSVFNLAKMGQHTMDVRYTLTLDDHLAWYDFYFATPDGACSRSSFPLVDRFRRWRYSRQLVNEPNRYVTGERTLEAIEQGLREFSPNFSFSTPWSDITLVAETSQHLFLAHTSMNAHIVPLRFFDTAAKRETYVSFAKQMATKVTTQ